MSVASQAEALTIMTQMALVYDSDIALPDKPHTKPDVKTAWARLSFEHEPNNQASLSNVIGKRKWRSTGALMIECFYPHGAPGDAMTFAEGYRDVYEGKEGDGGIWFRDVSILRNGDDKSGWYRLDVVATFEYTRIK